MGVQNKEQTRWSGGPLQSQTGYKWLQAKPGMDYFEVFALVARMDTVLMILALASQNHRRIHQMDVK